MLQEIVKNIFQKYTKFQHNTKNLGTKNTKNLDTFKIC